jgi:hypothetical protein
VSEFSIFAGQPDQLFKQVAAHYDAPAFARRARRVEVAHAELVERCRTQRAAWLEVVRARLARVADFGIVADELRELAAALDVALPSVVCVDNKRQAQRARTELADSVERFNRRWTRYLESLDLASLNRERADYNRYYVLEKECALRSAKLARAGFVPLRPLTIHYLTEQFPTLLVPREEHTR